MLILIFSVQPSLSVGPPQWDQDGRQLTAADQWEWFQPAGGMLTIGAEQWEQQAGPPDHQPAEQTRSKIN